MQHCITAWTSLPVGVVTLAERFDGRFVDAATFEAMVRHVAALLEPFEADHRFGERVAGKSTHLLGTSGTVTTVAGVHLGLPRYDRSQVDGCWLHIDQVRDVTHACSPRPTRNALPSPASAGNGPTSCWRAALF